MVYVLDGWKDRQRYCPCGKRCFHILSYSLEFRSNDSNLIWLNLHKDNYWNYDKSRCDYYNVYNDYIARYCVEKNPGNCSLIACIEREKKFLIWMLKKCYFPLERRNGELIVSSRKFFFLILRRKKVARTWNLMKFIVLTESQFLIYKTFAYFLFLNFILSLACFQYPAKNAIYTILFLF